MGFNDKLSKSLIYCIGFNIYDYYEREYYTNLETT